MSPAPPAAAIHYERFCVGKSVYHVVKGNLDSGTVSLETVHSPRLTSMWNLVSGESTIAAVTGTFFSPTSQKPVADIIVNGNQVAMGSIGSAIGVSWYGEVSIFDKPYHDPVDWGIYRFGLRGGVRVVQNGEVCPNPKAQRFRDAKIWGRAARSGIGLTAKGDVLLIATKSKVSLTEFGRAMRLRGVKEGLSLDGGGSTCLFYQGALVVPPLRKLSNLLVLRAHPSGKLGLPQIGSAITPPGLNLGVAAPLPAKSVRTGPP